MLLLFTSPGSTGVCVDNVGCGPRKRDFPWAKMPSFYLQGTLAFAACGSNFHRGCPGLPVPEALESCYMWPVNTNGIPFLLVGEFATHLRYFSGD